MVHAGSQSLVQSHALKLQHIRQSDVSVLQKMKQQLLMDWDIWLHHCSLLNVRWWPQEELFDMLSGLEAQLLRMQIKWTDLQMLTLPTWLHLALLQNSSELPQSFRNKGLCY